MKKTPERIERLAAEYVLGSLNGQARKGFERWMMESYRVRQEVWFWEDKLSHLAHSLPEALPPPRVWTSIEQRLWPDETAQASPQSEPEKAGWLSWLWPGWSLAATAAALVLTVLLVVQPEPEPQEFPGLAGAITQQDLAEPLWLISESARDHQLRLRPVAATATAPESDYELWVVPSTGSPISLGVIEVTDRTLQIELSEALRARLDESRTLAISLEPAGGSPTGAPTGPILHLTTLYEL